MSGKKKKFNSRFPPARIKKMMQSDENVGKVAWVVPCLISKALEIFAEHLMKTISDQMQTNSVRTLSTDHIKKAIKLKTEFIAVRELADGEMNGSGEFIEVNQGNGGGEASPKKRKTSTDEICSEIIPSSVHNPLEEPPKKRGRGRPRKQTSESGNVAVSIGQNIKNYSKHSSTGQVQISSKKNSKEDFDDEDDDDDEEDDDDEDYDDENYN